MQVIEVEDMPGRGPARTLGQLTGQLRDRVIPRGERDRHRVAERALGESEVAGSGPQVRGPPGQSVGNSGNDGTSGLGDSHQDRRAAAAGNPGGRPPVALR